MTVTSQTAAPCIFHFNDAPAIYEFFSYTLPYYDNSPAIQVNPPTGAVFPIHLGNSASPSP